MHLPARNSLVLRIWIGGLLVTGVFTAMLGLLAVTLLELERAHAYINRSGDLIDTTHLALSDLKDAESAQRGFLLTFRRNYLHPLTVARQQLPRRLDRLEQLVASQSDQVERVTAFRTMAEERMAQVDEVVDLAGQEAIEDARLEELLDRGRLQMDALRTMAQSIINSEQGRLRAQVEATEGLVGQTRVGVLLALPLTMSIMLLAIYGIVRRIRVPLTALHEGAGRVGAGDLSKPVAVPRGDEFGALAEDFNTMAVRLSEAEQVRREALRDLREANAALERESARVEAQGQFTSLLARAAQRLQRCEDESEFAATIAHFAELFQPGVSGALFLLNNSGNLLIEAAHWGDAINSDPCPSRDIGDTGYRRHG